MAIKNQSARFSVVVFSLLALVFGSLSICHAHRQTVTPTFFFPSTQKLAFAHRKNTLAFGEGLRDSYNGLPPVAKFVTGTVLGFSATKYAFATTFQAIRIVGIFFIVSELLYFAGALDEVRLSSDEAFLRRFKNTVTYNINSARRSIRSSLNLRSTSEQSLKTTVLGFVTGVAGGLII